jgi:hypothetical protein
MMLTVVLIVAAALVLGGKDLLAKARELAQKLPRPQVSWRQMAAAGLLIAAVVAFSYQQSPTPGPTPPPPPPAPAGPLDLVGLFVGQHGAADAAVVAALTGELADEIEWDGEQTTPILTSGVALDDLRRRARELRCRGVSIGQRQPAARDAIAKHLDEAVGDEGGPIDVAKRAAWVKAMREISEAAASVTR